MIRDIARAMEIPFGEADKLAKLVPEPVQGKSPPVREAIEQTPELKQLYNESPLHRELLDLAASLEGLNRNAGMHAAGVVIADKPLWEYVPCFRGQNDEIVTQFAMKEVEKAGLVKFDFLGLKTLTVIQTAVKLINQQRPPRRRASTSTSSRKDDADVYKMIARGDTTGVFQLESSGFREILKKLKPDCLEDIVAAVALYRPGPLEGGMVDDFIDRKHGRKKVEYPHPSARAGARRYLRRHRLPGAGHADRPGPRRLLARRRRSAAPRDGQEEARGDGEAEGEVPRRARRSSSVDAKIADQVFELMAFFAGYGFNRSHSAAYGWITYQTAYLKHHYPHEFMAGLMSCDADNIDNVVKFIAEARVDGPRRRAARRQRVARRTSRSRRRAAQGGKVIRFGMGAVKGVGANAVEAILEARAADGHVHVAVRAVPARRHPEVQPPRARAADQERARSTACRAAITARSCSRRSMPRSSAARRSSAIARSGQTSLFGLFAAPEPREGRRRRRSMGETYPEIEIVGPQAAARVREGSARLLRLGPPARSLSRRPPALRDRDDEPTSRRRREASGEHSIGGIVSQYREMITKKGDKMARFMLEDAGGTLEVIAFPKTFEKVRHVLVCDEPILCTGAGQERGHRRGARVEDDPRGAAPLSQLREQKTSRVDIHLNADMLTHDQIDELKTILANATRGALPASAPQDRAALRDRDRAARCVGRVADRGSADAPRAAVRRPRRDARVGTTVPSATTKNVSAAHVAQSTRLTERQLCVSSAAIGCRPRRARCRRRQSFYRSAAITGRCAIACATGGDESQIGRAGGRAGCRRQSTTRRVSAAFLDAPRPAMRTLPARPISRRARSSQMPDRSGSDRACSCTRERAAARSPGRVLPACSTQSVGVLHRRARSCSACCTPFT